MNPEPLISSASLRQSLRQNLALAVDLLNQYLRGEAVEQIEPILQRLGRGGQLPYWYEDLKNGRSMPNLDGKTIGSVIEMVFVAVLEHHLFENDFAVSNFPPLTINPAKGIDIPALELGIKSPSENYCTSEPFFSAYERVLGNAYDAVILLTDYQTAKKNPPPVRIQIIQAQYLAASEMADRQLCQLACKHRDLLLEQEGEAAMKKILQFLCHVNQQDWRGRSLLQLVDLLDADNLVVDQTIQRLNQDFQKKQRDLDLKGSMPLSESELESLLKIRDYNPRRRGIISACRVPRLIEYLKNLSLKNPTVRQK